ncbi:MAG: hypothetical protein Q9190_000642 [Brigantiaea leucoxantha]
MSGRLSAIISPATGKPVHKDNEHHNTVDGRNDNVAHKSNRAHPKGSMADIVATADE